MPRTHLKKISIKRKVSVKTKDDIRRQMRARRRALSPEERERAAKIIYARLIEDDDIRATIDPFECGDIVAVYLASPDEIDLSDVIRWLIDLGAKVVAPRWNGETYELAMLKSLSNADLRRGPMNILEPAEAMIVKPSDVDAWIVPGLAFTKDGKRLGYGGGWYDRLLASAAKWSIKIGVAHEFQIVEDLPHEPHDVLLDRVVTTALNDKRLTFTETSDGFHASVTVDSLPRQRALFFFSLFGLCMFPTVAWFTVMFVRYIAKGATALPICAGVAVFLVMVVIAAVSILSLLRVLGGPETAEMEVNGESGVCRKRFLGFSPRRTIRFRWSPWAHAVPFGHYFYLASGNQNFSVAEGGVEQVLFRTYGDTASELAIRMNIAHNVNHEQIAKSTEAILAALPRGMRIVRNDTSETIEVQVRSLIGLGPMLGWCGFTGIAASAILLLMATNTTTLSMTKTTILSWSSALSIVLIALVPLVWIALFLAIAHHALWTLFGRHRLTITGVACGYEVRLGPRVKHKSFKLGDCSRASFYPGNSLCITATNGIPYYCFNNLPRRCYLPLIVFVNKHANGCGERTVEMV